MRNRTAKGRRRAIQRTGERIERRQRAEMGYVRELAGMVSTRAQLDSIMREVAPGLRVHVLELMRPGLAAHLQGYEL